jgi:hypothetical protein
LWPAGIAAIESSKYGKVQTRGIEEKSSHDRPLEFRSDSLLIAGIDCGRSDLVPVLRAAYVREIDNK